MTDLSDLDLVLVAQWARTRWHVAHSLGAGEPHRPDLEGSIHITTRLLPNELADQVHRAHLVPGHPTTPHTH